MGLTLGKIPECNDLVWVVTESFQPEQQYVALATLSPKVTNQHHLELHFLSAHHTHEGNTKTTTTYWYDLQEFMDGVYEAKSFFHPHFTCQVWFEVQDCQILRFSERKQQVLQWFGVQELVIPFSCGHTHSLIIYGSQERASQAFQEYLGWQCRDCYRLADYLQSRTTNQKLGCPDLAGTRKQLEWAEKIRAKVLQDLLAWELEWEWFMTELEQRQIQDPDAELVTLLKQQESAAFWIENRALDLWGFLQLLQQEGY
jgi:hypothetical protein